MTKEKEIKKEPKKPIVFEELGLKQKVDFVYDSIVKPSKKKKSKEKDAVPRSIQAKGNKAIKKNKILVQYFQNNRTITYKVGQLINGLVIVDNKYYQGTTDFVWLYKKTPLVALKEWDMVPIGTKDYYDALEEGSVIDAQTITINALEASENVTGNKMDGKKMIWILIGGAVVAYVIFGGGQ